ncbi:MULTISPECIES: hypothetical protein [Cronobacter]|uniref:hypothetical protein n=1 Tax=Cronobacter TaxID=413496 RepID=UPI00029C5EA1|nr:MULTISPECIES: hypothetical protein [Cronobacter]CCK05581.1 hypothetical protein BN128_2692 [Cronobacter sakazakii 696]AXX02848.1 hypothetical protein CsakCS09_13055 [Cronobacter sakazakii]EKK3986130.1 hypothetical protein [Cronobacter sakazakii]ELY4120097.1 hypothetical protein [Cronobacter sakazakii]ELY6004127.1 hypothetical protein [Cronobacter sakazakii]
MTDTAKLKAAALAATPGRVGDRIDGSGSIKYRCVGADGSLVLLTDHKNNEYGFVGDNGEADELFFRLCTPEAVLELIAALEAAENRNAELEACVSNLQVNRPVVYGDGFYDGYWKARSEQSMSSEDENHG